jgi:YD repeat-containing protein
MNTLRKKKMRAAAFLAVLFLFSVFSQYAVGYTATGKTYQMSIGKSGKSAKSGSSGGSSGGTGTKSSGGSYSSGGIKTKGPKKSDPFSAGGNKNTAIKIPGVEQSVQKAIDEYSKEQVEKIQKEVLETSSLASELLVCIPETVADSAQEAELLHVGYEEEQKMFIDSCDKLEKEYFVPPIGDPVNPATGEFISVQSDIHIPFSVVDFPLFRTYRSKSKNVGSLGRGWISSLDMKIIRGVDNDCLDDAIVQKQLLVELQEMFTSATNELVIAQDALQEQKKKLLADQTQLVLIADYDLLPPTIREGAREATIRIDGLLLCIQNEQERLQILMDEALQQFMQAEKRYEDIQSRALVSEQNSRLNQYTGQLDSSEPYMNLGPEYIVLLDEYGRAFLFSVPIQEQWIGDAKASSSQAGSLSLLADGGYEHSFGDGFIRVFDCFGRLKEIYDSNGNSVNLEYQNETQIVSLTDNTGKTVNFEWQDGFLSALSDYSGREIFYSYNDDGMLESYTSAQGETYEYSYDDGRLISIQKPDQTQMSYSYYPGDGRLRSTQDEMGFTESFRYDDEQRCTEYRDPGGSIFRYYFDNQNRQVRVEYPYGKIEQFEYNQNGDLIAINTSDNNSLRGATLQDWDEAGNCIAQVYEDGSEKLYSYCENSLLESVQNRFGGIVNFDYSLNGLIEKISYPDGSSEDFFYSQNGKLVEQRNRRGLVRQYDYDSQQFLIAVTECWAGQYRKISFENDSLGRHIVVNLPDGEKEYCWYDPDGNLVAMLQTSGMFLEYEYNCRGDCIQESIYHFPLESISFASRPDLVDIKRNHSLVLFQQLRRVFDSRHLPTLVENADGIVLQYTYDGLKRVRSITMEGRETGQTCSFLYEYGESGLLEEFRKEASGIDESIIYKMLYDGLGRLAYIQNPDGFWKKYEYSGTTDIVQKVSQGGRSSHPEQTDFVVLREYELESGLPVVFRNRWGGQQKNEYNTEGRLVSMYRKDPEGRWVLYEDCSYSYMDGTAHFSQDGGALQIANVDGWGNVVNFQDAAGGQTFFVYDENGRLCQTENAAGIRNEYMYIRGKLQTKVVLDADGLQHAKTDYSYRFPLPGRVVIEQTNARGNSFELEMDVSGNVIRTRNANNEENTFSHDMYGNVLNFTDAEGRIFSFEYDGLGRCIAESVAGNVVCTYEYDGLDRLQMKKDAYGNSIEYSYDRFGSIENIVYRDVDGRELQRTECKLHIPENRFVQQTGSLCNEFIFDEYGRITQHVHPSGGVQTWNYNTAGQLFSATDCAGNQFQFVYDGAGRLISKRCNGNPLGSWSYDVAGNLIACTNQNVTYAYAYDSFNRLVQQDTSPLEQSLSYSYDSAGNLVQVSNRNQHYSIEYDYGATNELLEMRDSAGQQVRFSYDKSGREIEALYGDGSSIHHTFDDAGRISSIMQYEPTNKRVPAWGESYFYNLNGDLGATISQDGNISSYAYDGMGRVVSAISSGEDVADFVVSRPYYIDRNLLPELRSALLDHCKAYAHIVDFSSSSLDFGNWEIQYAYDDGGNRIVCETPKGQQLYEYNPFSQLVASADMRYSYDENGKSFAC